LVALLVIPVSRGSRERHIPRWYECPAAAYDLRLTRRVRSLAPVPTRGGDVNRAFPAGNALFTKGAREGPRSGVLTLRGQAADRGRVHRMPGPIDVVITAFLM